MGSVVPIEVDLVPVLNLLELSCKFGIFLSLNILDCLHPFKLGFRPKLKGQV